MCAATDDTGRPYQLHLRLCPLLALILDRPSQLLLEVAPRRPAKGLAQSRRPCTRSPQSQTPQFVAFPIPHTSLLLAPFAISGWRCDSVICTLPPLDLYSIVCGTTDISLPFTNISGNKRMWRRVRSRLVPRTHDRVPFCRFNERVLQITNSPLFRPSRSYYFLRTPTAGRGTRIRPGEPRHGPMKPTSFILGQMGAAIPQI